MKFQNASEVEQVAFSMLQADYVRGQNRARINNLFNGTPPFEDDEEHPVNVNFLEATRVGHDARAQFYNAFLRPGSYFTAHTDHGPKSKVSGWSQIVSTEMNRRMKRSMVYFETFRSKFALDILHGIGPAVWKNSSCWCPDAVGIEDVGIPANTMLTMENLPFFYIYRSYTLPEIIKLTRGPNIDPGWNMGVVKALIKQIDKEAMALSGNTFPEIWMPEKVAERVKGDGGFYAYDQCPLIYCFDFYFWNDNGKQDGWSRRMVLDTFSSDGSGAPSSSSDNDYDFARGKFLYDSGSRKVASHVREMLSFQFADLSAVAPFRYHSVRSLGFLLYAVCHLQNRMRCRFSESVFEALMNYYRVNSLEDADRALYVNMINRGFIDKSIEFVPQQERWQVNADLIELGMNMNQELISANSSSYTQPQNFGQDKTQKTKFQVMAEIQASTALVSSAFNQAYAYQEGEYREIFRRFCIKDSNDADVMSFRAAVLRQGVPEDLLCADYWDIEPSRVMGAGNKTLEMAISEQLLQMRPLFDPEPQREILRDVVFGITDDAARAERLVPVEPLKVSDTVHDAQLAAGTLLQGLPVAVKTGQNHVEYCKTMLVTLAQVIQRAQKAGGMATAAQINGMQNMAQNIQQHIQILAQDKEEKQAVAMFEKQLAKLMNFVKAFMQRLQEVMKKQAAQNGQQQDPQTQAKLMGTVITAKAKAELSKQSHAQRTAQKQVAFEKEEQRKQRAFEQEQHRENVRTVAEHGRGKIKSVGEQ